MQVLLAVALALASAVCYSAAAVLQHREVSTHRSGGLELVAALARRRAWWAGAAATGAGALLHLAALGSGALLLVQPLGVTALVFALLINARLNRTPPDAVTCIGAACVVLGLPAALSAIPGSAGPTSPVLSYWTAAAAVAVPASALAVTATVIRHRFPRAVPILYAVAAAVCFGLTSATAKAVWLGRTSPIVIGAGLAAALAGVVLAQHAYRDGGLGAPLATLTLVDPATAGVVAVLALGEPISTTWLHMTIGLAGAVATTAGVVLLSPRHVRPARPPVAHRPLLDSGPARLAA